MIEFEEHGSIDVAKYIERFGSYYSFLVKYEPAYTVRLSDREAAAKLPPVGSSQGRTV